MNLKQRVWKIGACIALLVVTAVAETGNPVADPKAVVTSGNARFTVLTPQLLRMEWAADGSFEDHASMVFINRRLPAPKFTASPAAGGVTIRTGEVELTYSGGGRFTPDNLRVEFALAGKRATWRPGMAQTGNLLGTTRTLDGIKGATSLEPGLVSRDGWVLVDDSTRPLFDNSEWPWVMPRPAGERQDWYLFAHGHDYKQALKDFTLVAGKIPLPPRFAFGAWWSRYWQYTDVEFKQLVEDFENHNVPLDVLVIDMDWHLTFELRFWKDRKDQAGQRLGWTGYTWNPVLFPDPAGFLAWTEKHGLKTPLNVHPASGVQPHEAQYPEMARVMGIDPASKKYVPFDIASKKFTENYFSILHHPLEKMGVDFWWLDWQQQHTTSLPGVNPTWWLNYVHFTDFERRGKRGMLYHRWGGLGNHRYQLGFSGDTLSVWESLQFQPFFTATAANVGYAYWSHDIGGHMPGEVSPELYTRWVQWGVFSPILRTHTTKNPRSERRIWAYPPEHAKVMRDSFLLRYALIPYIYSEARRTYDSGVAFLRPLYYDHPEVNEAYEFKDQYIFGESMLAAPITTPLGEQTQLARKAIWLPEGEWYEWFTGKPLKGPARLERNFSLEQVPVYVKAGAIIPMQPEMRYVGQKPVDPLILTVFPGARGSTRVYEDHGNSLGYKTGEFTWTEVRHEQRGGERRITIAPAQGRYPGMPESRAYEVRLVGVWPPERVFVNGKPLHWTRQDDNPGWRYDGETLTAIIPVARSSVRQPVEITVHTREGEEELLDGVPGKLARMRRAMAILNGTWQRGWTPDLMTAYAQTGNRITLRPQTAREELRKLSLSMPEIEKAVLALEPDGVARVVLEQALALMKAE